MPTRTVSSYKTQGGQGAGSGPVYSDGGNEATDFVTHKDWAPIACPDGYILQIHLHGRDGDPLQMTIVIRVSLQEREEHPGIGLEQLKLQTLGAVMIVGAFNFVIYQI